MPILATLLRALTGVQTPAEEAAAAAAAANAPNPASQQQQPPLHQGSPSPRRPAVQLHEPARPFAPILSRRSFRQMGLYFGGAGFLALSILISKRASVRHQLRARLRYFTPSTHHLLKKGEVPPGDAGKEPMMALEALNLATLNVVSFAVMLTGGVSWALDLSCVDDMRRLARRSMNGVHGRLDPDMEKELAEWVGKTLGIDVHAEEGLPAVEGTQGGDEGGK